MQHSIKDRDSSESFFMNYPIFLFIHFYLCCVVHKWLLSDQTIFIFLLCVCVPVQKLIIYGEYQKTEMRNTLREKNMFWMRDHSVGSTFYETFSICRLPYTLQ